MHTLSARSLCWTRRLRLAPTCLLAWTLWAMACGSSPTTNPNLDGKRSAAAPEGQILVMQATSDVPALDVWIDGQRLVQGLAPRRSSRFLALPPGSHKLEVRLPSDGGTDMPLWSGGIYLQDGQRVLACVLGRAADSAITASPTRLNVIAEPLSPAQPGQLPLRLLHASPALGAVDIVDGDSGEPPLLAAAPYSRFSSYVDVGKRVMAPGLLLRQTGERFDLGTLSTQPIQQAGVDGHAQTAILLGETNPLAADTARLDALLLDETSGELRDLSLQPYERSPKSTLYVLNASPDAGPIDVYSTVNGARLLGGLDYRQATSLLELVPTSYSLEVRQASLPTVLLRTSLRLWPNQHWAVYLGGRKQGGAPSLHLVALPRARTTTAQTQRRGVFAIADGSKDLRMTLATAAGPSFVDPVPYGGASAYRMGDLSAEPLRLGISGSKQQWEIDMPQPVIDAAAKQILALYLTGTLTDPRAPLSALAVLESTASPSQAALVVSLRTAALPSP